MAWLFLISLLETEEVSVLKVLNHVPTDVRRKGYHVSNIIVFNSIPKPFKPFPLSEADFDFKFDLDTSSLSFHVLSHFSTNHVSLCLEDYSLGFKRVIEIAKIELYHSFGHVNFEQTFESAKILANEIVKRFNQKEKQGGQLCFVLS